VRRCLRYVRDTVITTATFLSTDEQGEDQPLKFIDQLIEECAMQVTYDPAEDTGRIIYNLSLIRNEDLEYAITVFRRAYRAGLSVSDRIKFLESGESIDGYRIAEGCTGVCTMCTITLDGLFLRRGVPYNPIGGGVVEVVDRIPKRFIHFITYSNTTIDPLEVLVTQEITSITQMIKSGSGMILANMRECHMESETLVGEVLDELAGRKFTGILDLGVPNVPLLGVPISPQYFGVSMVGGTNPMAALKEGGRQVVTRALKGLIDIETMGHIEDF
jgi:repressor of nif and glnA expression